METEAMDTRQKETETEDHSDVHTTQPRATGPPEEPTDKQDPSRSSESLADEDALLLPGHTPTISHTIEKTPEKNAHSNFSVSAAVCTSSCNGHATHTSSSSKSPQNFTADASQIQRVAGDDCCVHCVLACLFCELLSLCSAVAQCLACGLECDALCCCCCCGGAAGQAAGCAEDPCSALLDCGLLEDCCQSSDCLEICLECCSICFPT